jgi:hypothetical protein
LCCENFSEEIKKRILRKDNFEEGDEMKNIIRKIAACSLFFLMATPMVCAKTILYVPFDDRPVSAMYEIDTVKAANFDILVPPTEYLAGHRRVGDPVQLWKWIKENANKADAMVLSADALIYGGLVDSRIHDISSNVLEWRLKRFHQLREANPNARMYVYSTIMRSPHASFGGVEPPYYETHGGDIFQLTALKDKAEIMMLTDDEQRTIQTLEKAIPMEYMSDWLNRREKNFNINAKLIDLTKEGTFDYLLIGRDDTSPFSQSHKESRMLSKLAAKLPDGKYVSFPGADQLGMVLLARAYNKLTMQIPVVEIQYALGTGVETVASYEDQPIGLTIRDHIRAAGGIMANGLQKPDLLLAVNTPLTSWTKEAEVFGNLPIITDGTRQFVTTIENWLMAGKPVAVADIAFANGADNSLMRELYERGLLNKISAYSGWNTASNTLGFAIGQGMMAKGMSDKERQRLLAVRYLDDWAYQANIRKEMYREISYPEHFNWRESEITTDTETKIRLFAGQYLWVEPDKIKVSFPWHRMFEIKVEIEQ